MMLTPNPHSNTPIDNIASMTRKHITRRARFGMLSLFAFLFLLSSSSLSVQAGKRYTPPLIRIDSILYSLSRGQSSPDTSTSTEALYSHIRALDLIGRGVLGLGEHIDSIGLLPAITNRYAHPALLKLASDVQQLYTAQILKPVQEEITSAFRLLHKRHPRMPLPDYLYTHISGFHQRIIVADGFLSIALDFYLGKDFHLYKTYFSPWQQAQSTIDRMAVDAVLGWIISELPEPRDRALTLKDKMRYWGEIYRLLHKVFPWRTEPELFGFTPSEWQWLKNNKKHLIRNAKERGELDASAPIIIDKYFTEQPQGAALPKEAPRLIGPWLSYKYCKKLK
ncbi:MAG: hypothetical protein SPI72_03150 [Porphyromonas sp.]|nr:hypothetical protein [Porphyromonas sp.]